MENEALFLIFIQHEYFDNSIICTLSEKLDKDTAEQLISYIEAKVDKTVVGKTTHLAYKEDLANAKTDMIKWFVGLFIALALMIIGLYFKG